MLELVMCIAAMLTAVAAVLYAERVKNSTEKANKELLDTLIDRFSGVDRDIRKLSMKVFDEALQTRREIWNLPDKLSTRVVSDLTFEKMKEASKKSHNEMMKAMGRFEAIREQRAKK